MNCDTCAGSGILQVGGQAIKCPICNGTGRAPFNGTFKIYELGPLVLNALAAGTITQRFDNYDFEVYFLTLVAVTTATGAVQASPSATALITDTSSRYQFSNQQVHVGLYMGDAKNPFPLPVPYLVKKTVNLQLDVTDVSGIATTYHVGLIGLQDLSS